MSKNMLAFNYLLAEKPINTEILRKLSKPLLKIYNSLDRNRIPNIMLYSDFSFSDILKYITWCIELDPKKEKDKLIENEDYLIENILILNSLV